MFVFSWYLSRQITFNQTVMTDGTKHSLDFPIFPFQWEIHFWAWNSEWQAWSAIEGRFEKVSNKQDHFVIYSSMHI